MVGVIVIKQIIFLKSMDLFLVLQLLLPLQNLLQQLHLIQQQYLQVHHIHRVKLQIQVMNMKNQAMRTKNPVTILSIIRFLIHQPLHQPLHQLQEVLPSPLHSLIVFHHQSVPQRLLLFHKQFHHRLQEVLLSQ